MSADPQNPTDRALSRRRLLKLGGAAVVAAGAGSSLRSPQRIFAQGAAKSNGITDAYQMRLNAARMEAGRPPVVQKNNGDEQRYPTHIGNFSKGLPHNNLGEVDAAAYGAFFVACERGRFEDFERIPMGGSAKLTNPMAGMALVLQGPDARSLTQPPAPAFASAEIASEIAENYWMALTRDVAYSDYETNPLTVAAAADMSRFSAFRGPKESLQVTPRTLFRGFGPGTLNGPYLSQFMLLETPFGAETISRRMRTPVAGQDFMTNYADWLSIQRGHAPSASLSFDATPRYIRNGRDLGEWVHIDVLFQAYFNAMLAMFRLGVPYDSLNPYNNAITKKAFGTLGDPYTASVLAAVAKPALVAVWFQKWFNHRRLRPEAFAGRIHNHVTRSATYPIHREILDSAALPAVFSRFGSYLLPMAFPEGSPTHPAYGAGHATVAGACTTVLKALFDESFVIPSPVIPSADGQSLLPYAGPSLTVGGELNKLATNVAIGRNIAGVHWRSDATESLKLGEELAIWYLREELMCLKERNPAWQLTKFDGTTITLS